jgi:DNA-binding response OmpR family regulator
MIRIMVHDARAQADEGRRVVAALSGLGLAVDLFSDGPRFLEAAVTGPLDLVVYALGSTLEADLGVLRLLRRAQPDVGLIILTEEASLQTRTAVQPLRPMFYSVGPLDPAEVIELVQAALRRRQRSGGQPPRCSTPPSNEVRAPLGPPRMSQKPSL